MGASLAPRPDGFAFDLTSLGVQVRLLPGRLAQLGFLRAPDEAEPHAGGVGYDDDDHEREDYGEYAVYRGVDDDLLDVRLGLGVAEELVVSGRLDGGGPLGEEAEQGVGGEDLLVAGRERHRGVPRQRQRSHPGVPQLAHLDQDG